MIVLLMMLRPPSFFFFFFNDTATTEIYTLSLHDALPICEDSSAATFPTLVLGRDRNRASICRSGFKRHRPKRAVSAPTIDRKSTRLNSSHSQISYAVFCLKKKKNTVKQRLE